jgi:hypothetical protein
MNNYRRQLMLRARPSKSFEILMRRLYRLPTPRISREHLEGVATDAVRVMRGIFEAAGNRRVDTHPQRDFSIGLTTHVNKRFEKASTKRQLTQACCFWINFR